MPGPSPYFIPDSFSRVWAFGDCHGVRSGLLAALVKAGIATPDGHWCAPAGTALVGCGDYLDRGTDSRGLIYLLATLAKEAPMADGLVVLVRGNHEQMVLNFMYGDMAKTAAWLVSGGEATLDSLGIAHPRGAVVLASLPSDLETALPGLRSWLLGMPECARWRDVLFVHAGPPRERALEDYGRQLPGDWRNAEVDHLWLRGDFYRVPGIAEDDRYEAVRAAGIARVVFGHTPQDAPTLFHNEQSLCLDTNACGNGLPASLALARIPATGSLAGAEIVSVDTSGAPDRMKLEPAGGRR